MIVVKVELWPYGFEERKKLLCQATIANDGTGTKTRGNYRVKLSGQKRNAKKTWRTAEVKEYARKSYNVWYLVRKALEEALG